MTKKLAIFMLAGTLMTSGAALWASAGDATQQGVNGTTTGTPAAKTAKKHHGHHHTKGNKAKPTTASTTPVSK